ncbi:MAG TPA: NADH-quinone oxidoreductase subunit J, partial [Pyrinomonadaceae bacterium]|nr:NADH-quinone oxidoreductase subunit J [Pyrinomonadaceae bacterium]
MKFCSLCQEEFADKFSFCPVDGTPLTAVTPKVEDPSVTIGSEQKPRIEVPFNQASAPVESEPVYAAADNSKPMVLRDEYHLTMLDDAGLTSRLTHEIKDVAHEYQLTWPEFKRDPFGFTKRTFVGYGQMLIKFLRKPNVGLAMGAAFLGMIALVGAVMVMDRTQSTGASRAGLIAFAVIAGALLIALFSTWLGRERGAAVMGAEPSDSRSVVAGMVSSFAFLFVILGVIVWLEWRDKQLLAMNNPNEELQVEQMLDIP